MYVYIYICIQRYETMVNISTYRGVQDFDVFLFGLNMLQPILNVFFALLMIRNTLKRRAKNHGCWTSKSVITPSSDAGNP